MFSGIVGSGGTNMTSDTYAQCYFPFPMWQLYDFRKYIIYSVSAALIAVISYEFLLSKHTGRYLQAAV
jgi:hypothetical protein